VECGLWGAPADPLGPAAGVVIIGSPGSEGCLPLPLTAAFMSMQGDVDARKREALAEPETEAAILYQRRGPSHPRPLRTGARPRPTPPVDTRWMRSG